MEEELEYLLNQQRIVSFLRCARNNQVDDIIPTEGEIQEEDLKLEEMKKRFLNKYNKGVMRWVRIFM